MAKMACEYVEPRYEGFPNYVPVLSGKDMVKGEQEVPEGAHRYRCCLLGWCCRLFPPDTIHHAIRTVTEVIYEQPEQQGVKLADACITEFNDNNSLRNNAEIFNKAMERLGYVEDYNPDDELEV